MREHAPNSAALTREEMRMHYHSHRISVVWLSVLLRLFHAEKYGPVPLSLLIEKAADHDITKVDESPELIQKLNIDCSKGTIFERFYKIHLIDPRIRTMNDHLELRALIKEHTAYEDLNSKLFYDQRKIDANHFVSQLLEEIIHIADVSARGFDGEREFRERASLASQSSRYLPKEEDRKLARFLESIYPLVIQGISLEDIKQGFQKTLSIDHLVSLMSQLALRPSLEPRFGTK